MPEAALARPVLKPGQLYIDGGWREAAGSATMEVIDPSTGAVVGTVADAADSDLDSAVAAARTAFERGSWSRLPARERARTLHRVADIMRERVDELVAIESLDVGKPVTFSRPVDVLNSADQFEYCSALAQTIDGSVRDTPMNAFAYTRREPHGVVGAITPFNFPLVLSSNKLAPALAAGNSIVHKPAPDTPLSALAMAAIFEEAGIPAGVVNVVTGGRPALGEAMLRHPDINKIAFTGSTTVGRIIASSAGQNLKPISLELGGNGAQIVFADADLATVIPSIVKGMVFNAGQFCMGAPRLLVEASIEKDVVDALLAELTHVPVGDPFDPNTAMGPMAAERHLRNVEKYVALGIESGGVVLTGGERLELNGGFYYLPTVVTGVANNSRIVQEEVFGPVLTVQTFRDEAEAIVLSNSTPYGLAAGLHTTNIARAHRVAAQLEAGIVWVNDWAMLDPAVPFGGVKSSGYGRENGHEALDEYTRTKSVVISLG